jgi:hypothetical protein
MPVLRSAIRAAEQQFNPYDSGKTKPSSVGNAWSEACGHGNSETALVADESRSA